MTNTRNQLMSMFRIVDGFVYEGKLSPDRHRVTTRDLGHGHREFAVNQCVDWVEAGPLDPDSRAAQILRGEIEDPDLEEKREASIKRGSRRARKTMRLRCKVQGLCRLLTLTYRNNVTDLQLCQAHLKEFLRRIRKVIPGFEYVACFETQKRGAWHVHLAIRQLPGVLAYKGQVTVKSFNVVRAVWLSVTKEHGGNIDVGRAKHLSKLTPARCAAYIAKYCMKAYAEGRHGSKRYRASLCDVPKPTVTEFRAASMRELVEMVMGIATEGGRVVATSWLSDFGDCYFVASERPS